MPHIEVIEYDRSEGQLREIYDGIIQKRGGLASVHMIQSLNPESIVNHMDLYLTIMFGKSPLRRVQREMMAVVVSKANNCEYCQEHHAEAVNHYWKNEEKIKQFKADYRGLELSESDKLLCDLAWSLTREPWKDNEVFSEKLRQVGLSDRAILDAHLVISYFNFVNRLVLGLGATHSPEEVKGYNYD